MNTHFLVETGYLNKHYDRSKKFESFNQAYVHYRMINTHSGYKKRLVRVTPDGTRTIMERLITKKEL